MRSLLGVRTTQANVYSSNRPAPGQVRRHSTIQQRQAPRPSRQFQNRAVAYQEYSNGNQPVGSGVLNAAQGRDELVYPQSPQSPKLDPIDDPFGDQDSHEAANRNGVVRKIEPRRVPPPVRTTNLMTEARPLAPTTLLPPAQQNPVTQNPVTQNPVTQNPAQQNPVAQVSSQQTDHPNAFMRANEPGARVAMNPGSTVQQQESILRQSSDHAAPNSTGQFSPASSSAPAEGFSLAPPKAGEFGEAAGNSNVGNLGESQPVGEYQDNTATAPQIQQPMNQAPIKQAPMNQTPMGRSPMVESPMNRSSILNQERPRIQERDQTQRPRQDSLRQQIYQLDCDQIQGVILQKSIRDIALNMEPKIEKGKVKPQECEFEGQIVYPRNWCPQTVNWTASAACSKPLYFQHIQLERYGHTQGPIVQPFISAAHFFGSAIMWPYKAGIHPPNECVYALGYYRPGDCAPWLCEPFPWSVRGAASQALFTAGYAGFIR